MKLSGIQPFTLLDFPDRTACIAFLPGCNFRCGYCHNPEFVLPDMIQKIRDSFVDEETFFSFLEKRKGKLDGVVVSGGEPTIWQELPMFLNKIKERGFLVKLDTNGNNPAMLRSLLELGLVDYVAMDLKTDPERYPEVAGACARPENIRESISLLMHANIPSEFRCTLIQELHPKETLEAMAAAIRGSERVYLQIFRAGHTLDPAFSQYHAFSQSELEEIRMNIFEGSVKHTSIRS